MKTPRTFGSDTRNSGPAGKRREITGEGRNVSESPLSILIDRTFGSYVINMITFFEMQKKFVLNIDEDHN